MALKDAFRRAIGRDQQHERSASVSTASTKPGTGTTTPNHADLALTATSTSTADGLTNSNSKDASNLTPAITLTKTHSRLSKSLTWTSSRSKEGKPSKKELKEKKALEDWKKQDASEWSAPKSSRPGKKNQKCQDTLRAFDFKQFEQDANGAGRSKSICSGISPSGSRAGSMDVGNGEGLQKVLSAGRKRSSGAGIGPGKLSQEVGAEGDSAAKGHKRMQSVEE